ncbi:quinone-dependent dihydroorotate dehydrogenase [Legionella israelensis]|uniref:Dihydroorotate dehydrogenase (quinone) n=1 Tax=Legionella israelensis TaxID=454 RepID=A0AAX1EF37_9GAMM|nr:quinone-dependent dihydroorotate dehydrogenase [Legionella israelensis]QBR83718.1 quinone-dependent dihydroorotate dehydrogenase [Legionella israelensis]
MYKLIRPLLFRLDAETAHTKTLSALHWLPSCCFKKPAESPVQAMGLSFSHPVGLAAGLDKNAKHLNALAKLGFSFIEVGTVTPRPQSGNPKPRLFRLPQAEALINRMGFNNEGVDALISNISDAHYQGILGINIGKNKDTPLNKAVEDYIYCMEKVYPYASYITVNISSPNTPDLRRLQQKNYFEQLLSDLTQHRLKLRDQFHRHVPMAVKLSPDENEESLKRMADAVMFYDVEGIIATNTTCARGSVGHLPNGQEEGGLSGRPLAERSTHCLRLLKTCVGDKVTLIGVGGIDSIEVARQKMQAGASLLQLYTGLIYQGPALVSQLSRELDLSIY